MSAEMQVIKLDDEKYCIIGDGCRDNVFVMNEAQYDKLFRMVSSILLSNTLTDLQCGPWALIMDEKGEYGTIWCDYATVTIFTGFGDIKEICDKLIDGVKKQPLLWKDRKILKNHVRVYKVKKSGIKLKEKV